MPKLRLDKHAKKAVKTPEAEIELTEPVAHPETHAQEHNELSRLRGIIFGTLEHDQQELLARLETRIAAQAEKTREELEALVTRLENRIAELDSRSTRDQADLRVQMRSHRDLLSEAIEERGAQVSQLVNKDLLELRQSKVDREHFSTFLSGLAAHLEHGDVPVDPATPTAESETEKPASLPPLKSGETKLALLPPALKPLRLGRPPWHPTRPS